MTREEFQNHLSEFVTSKAWAMSEPLPPTPEARLRNYEQRHGIVFPPEYKHVASTVGCGDLGFSSLFSVDDGEFNIDAEHASAPGLPKTFVPIADNGCGDFYGFVVENGICSKQIFFADHEQDYLVSSTEFADLYEYIVRYAFSAA